MGIYVVTGGSGGIGKETVELLKKDGHEVINIDIKKGDIESDLSTPDGRQMALDELYRMYPDGIDGLICSAGVSGACGDPRLILALNYFGTISMVAGTFDLLRKKNGNCVVTVSNTISHEDVRKDIADLLNNNGDDEERILNYVGNMYNSDLQDSTVIYISGKYALTRWMRRRSATYAACGVRINAIAPGNVNTPMTATMSINDRAALDALPIPTKYGKETLMEPKEVAMVTRFLISPQAMGINGITLFVDGGTDALLNSEKVY